MPIATSSPSTFKGTSPALADVIAGHVDLMFAPVNGVRPQVQAGKLRALAVAGPKRMAAFPDAPPIVEAIPRYTTNYGWFGVLGPAKLPMTRFYTLITRTRPPVTPAVISTMYGHLKDAANTEIGDDIRARLDDLILYTRACELRLAYDAAKGSKRQPAFEELLRHAWRIRTRGMIHTQALWRDAPRRDKAVKLPPDHDTWKTAPDYTRAEIDALLEAHSTEAR